MNLPQKSVKGAIFRQWVVDSLDRLIDACTAMRLRPGPGISIRETPAGTIVSLAKTSHASAPVSVSGGTASAGYAGPFRVTLSGGTASVKNGADPESPYAGEVIIGTTHHSMPTGTLAAGTGTVIYLTVYYSTALPDLVYAFNSSLSTAVLGSQGWYCELARVTAAGLIQTHWGGNIEISGRWM